MGRNLIPPQIKDTEQATRSTDTDSVMAWCLKLPLDVQQQINHMRFEGTPSARAIKAFEIAADRDYKFIVNAKDPEDYILFPSKNGGRWRNGAWRGAP